MNESHTVTIISDALPNINGKAGLVLSRLEGNESISTIYSYSLQTMTSPDEQVSSHVAANIEMKKLIGSEFTIKIELSNVDSAPREISGIASKVEFQGMLNNQAIYNIEIKPWVYLTTLTSDFKIFQNKSVEEIIKEVLEEFNFLFEFRLSSVYPPIKFQVQYGETDFNFIQRLMEEWGVYWFYEHSDSRHTMIFADHVGAFRRSTCSDYHSINYHPENPLAHKEYISQFDIQEEIISGKVLLNDFDFTKPLADMSSMDVKPRKTNFNHMEVYQWPGKYSDLEIGDKFAKFRMEALGAKGVRAKGQGAIRGIVCGSVFKLKNYPREKENREYMVLSSSLKITELKQRTGGNSEFEFWSKFTVQPSNKIYRHPQMTAKPVAKGLQSAVVVGPEGPELWTDNYGRVKVHFYWDRYGIYRESDSCWLRVGQSSAGGNFGSVYIPRVGQEVLVGFINDDPNQPIIVSSLYNDVTMPPWQLPANVTQSGFITHSIGGGVNNFNGFRFEDLMGLEKFWLQAERDMFNLVKNNELHQILANHNMEVGGNETTDIQGSRSETVGGDEEIKIGSNRSHSVTENDTTDIGGDQQTSIEGNQQYKIQGDHEKNIGGNDSLDVSGEQSIKVNKSKKIQVQQDLNEDIQGEKKVKIGKNYSLQANDKIELVVGSASIVLESNGNISINGSKINIEGSDAVQISGQTVDLN